MKIKINSKNIIFLPKLTYVECCNEKELSRYYDPLFFKLKGKNCIDKAALIDCISTYGSIYLVRDSAGRIGWNPVSPRIIEWFNKYKYNKYEDIYKNKET